jgi:hypothetical protein
MRGMVAIGKQAWFALMSRKSATTPRRSPVQTRPRLLTNIPLHPELLVLTPQTRQLVAFRGRQASDHLLPSALLLVSRSGPGADRLRSRLELPGKLLRGSTRLDQIDHLTAKLRRIRWTGYGDREHLA